MWVRKKESDYYIVSKCGKYKISKCFVNGVAIYTLWRDKEMIASHKPLDELKEMVNAPYPQDAGSGV